MRFLPAALRHRLPVSVRHHWRLVVAAIALTALTIGVLGAYRVRPIALASGAGDDNSTEFNVAGSVDLFDTTVAHAITLTFAQDAYDRMVATFKTTDEKEYIEADLVIDGVALESVGIRLKGNSTLRTLAGNGQGGRGPGGFQAPTGEEGGFGPGFGGTTLSFDAPEELPWLISFDRFVEGRRYQGHENIALRPAGQGGSTLNEAVSTTLVGLAGEPTQRWNYSALTVNDRPTTTRLVLEVPDKPYAAQLGNGVLYKSLSTGSFTYKGEDPTAYVDDFDQINRKGSQDLQPVIDLLRWVNEATDEQFAAELGEHVDVESFARYVALQNLLLNGDDMAGPGRNYYLYYDLDTKLFSVITWDLNLALSGDAAQGPFDASTIGGPGGGQFPGGGQLPGRPGGGLPGGEFPGGGFPGGGLPGGDGGGFPGGDGGGFPGGAPPGIGPGGFGGGHVLKEKFLASDAFRELYLETYRELYDVIYSSGAALTALDDAVRAARSAGATVSDDQVVRLQTLITNRTSALAADTDVRPQ